MLSLNAQCLLCKAKDLIISEQILQNMLLPSVEEFRLLI